MFNELLGCG